MKKKALVVFIAFALLGGLVGASCAKPAPAEVTEWKIQACAGPIDSAYLQGEIILDATNKALAGKLHQTYYGIGDIVPYEEMAGALSEGVYEGTLSLSMMYSNAGSVVFGLPYGWETYDQVMEFFYDYGFLEFMREIYAEKNLFFVGPLPGPPCYLLTTSPVHKVEDMKGLKIWSEGPPASLVSALGGKPIIFDVTEVYMGAKLGTIDGAYYGAIELESMKLKEVMGYVCLPPIVFPVNMDWVINLDAWNALPPDVQETYEATFRANQRKQFDEVMVWLDEAIEASKAAGVQFITLEPSELERFQAAGRLVWGEIAAADADSARAVQMLTDYLTAEGIIK